nr:hypothetical protein [Nostoc sp. ChiQUE02]
KPRDLGAFALKAKATAGLIYSWQVPHRKTFCYSKSEEMLRHSIRLVIHYLKYGSVPLTM